MNLIYRRRTILVNYQSLLTKISRLGTIDRDEVVDHETGSDQARGKRASRPGPDSIREALRPSTRSSLGDRGRVPEWSPHVRKSRTPSKIRRIPVERVFSTRFCEINLLPAGRSDVDVLRVRDHDKRVTPVVEHRLQRPRAHEVEPVRHLGRVL